MMSLKRIVIVLCVCILIFPLVSCVVEDTDKNEKDLTDAAQKSESETSGESSEAVSGAVGEQTESTMTETDSGTEDEAYSITNIHSLDRTKKYVAKGEELFVFKLKDTNYYIIQGGYFDGEYYYVAAIKKYEDGYEDAKILCMDAEGRRLRESDALPLDHANSITYNDKIDKLVVAHCHSVDGHYYRYSFIDPKTLTVTETADKSYPFFAIAYSPEKEMYASGEWGGEAIDIWNSDFEHVKSVAVSQPGSLSQGVDCDGEGIYFVRSEQNGYPAEIRIYNWNCKLYCKVVLDLPDGVEPENISVIDGEVFVVGTDWNRRCGVAYKIAFELSE